MASAPTASPAPLFRNILVGVDGGPGGRDAAALAHRLMDPAGTLTLVHVHVGDVPLVPSAMTWDAAEREAALRLLDRERAHIDPEAQVVATAAASPGEGLHRLAERRGADLIVVGSCARTLLGRVLVGDDARAALNGTPCAVATAPRGYAEHRGALGRVGVGYDDSPESNAALEIARALAGRTHGTVEVLSVMSMPALMGPGPWDRIITDISRRTGERLGALEGVESSAVWGVPVQELVALGHRVDLLVVGSRAYGPVRRLVLGSTAAYLQRHAPCPLLVLPRTARTAADDDAADDVVSAPLAGAAG